MKFFRNILLGTFLTLVSAATLASGFVPVGGSSAFTPPASGFAPNLPSGMTVIVDRQWNPTDGSISGGVLPPPSLTGTDSFSMTWHTGDGASQVPIIATPASLTSTIGQTIPAPPDSHSTIMAVHYPTGEAGGTAPFILSMAGSFTYKRIYMCVYVFEPTGFNTTGNNIKWLGVESHAGTGSANHIFMLSSGDSTDYRADWMVLQGGHGNQELGGESSPTGFLTALTYPPQGTGIGWWLSMQGRWLILEWFAQQETTPGVSADGIFESWITVPGGASTVINHWDNLTFNGTSGDPNAFNAASFVPYYGGGGSTAPSPGQYIVLGRYYVAGSN